jgi:putative membrane protein
MMYDWVSTGGWGMGFGILFMLLFWGLIILGIVALIRWLLTQSSPKRRAGDKTALEIVQERYARGEIERDEYEQKMRDLIP